MNSYNKKNKYLLIKIFYFIYNKKGLTAIFCFLNFFAYLQKTDSVYHQKYYYNSGNISSEGSIENSLPTGLWKNYYDSGALKSEGEKRAGKSEGKWIFYSQKGQIEKEIEYAKNFKNGRYQQFDTTGKLILENWYKNDTLIGVSSVFKNGKLIIETNYEKGLKSGVEKIYDENDQRLIETINYTNNEKESNLVINQFDLQKQKKGLWRTFYTDGKLKSECFYQNNQIIGNCKEWTEKGNLIIDSKNIEQKNTVEIKQTFHSNGKVACFQAYLGDYKNGVSSTYDSLGNLLGSALYKLDTLVAKGFILSNGIYDSAWTYFYPNSQKYATGKYKNGIKVGEWTYFNESENPIQKGKYRKGIIDGEWIWYFNNGQIRSKENYIGGKREGLSVEYDSLGTKITEGNYVNDIQDGNWFYKKNNLTEVGHYQMGSKEGEWKHFYKENTICFKGTFKSNIPVGRHFYYFNNGQIMKYGKYKKGLKTGDWQTYTKDGIFIHTYYYEKGKLVSVDGDKSIKYED
jgi:antitoxin component YwqK of YwqJK toxin-antitoxin module